MLRFTAPVSAFEMFSCFSCWYRTGSLVCCAIAEVASVVLAKAEPVKARRVILNVSDMVNVSVYVVLSPNYGFVGTVSIQRSTIWRNLANGDLKNTAKRSRAKNTVERLSLNFGVIVMFRVVLSFLAVVFAVSACTTTPSDPNQRQVFRIRAGDVSEIQFRHLDTVNALRQARGLNALQLSAELTAAAKTHALDISRQNRPWHFGSDGSNPIQRVQRAGYTGAMLSENLSETFENDTETLDAWMRDPVTRTGILHPNARNIGFSWHQESNGKIWWVQVIGS